MYSPVVGWGYLAQSSPRQVMHRVNRWSDVTYLWSQCDRHFVGQHVVLCVVKWWRFVALFEYNWISWFKKMAYYRYLIEKVTSTDVRITNISQSLPHKMAENCWYEEITSPSPYVYHQVHHQFFTCICWHDGWQPAQSTVCVNICY